MKFKFSIILSSLALALSVGAGVSFLNNKNSAESVEAIGNYSTDASTYYNDITATSGQALAGQLHDLITKTHRTYTSYNDNGSNGYQKNTDQYYENGSKVNNYIYEFYSGVKWPAAWDPDSGSTTGGYNREHCWCQSNSVNTSGTQMWGEKGGGADMHHLRPVESRLNSTRGNNKYGEISNRDSYKVYAKYGTNTTYALGGYNNNGVFEPLDSKKGDVARIILYTYLHYNSYSVATVFGGNATTNGNGDSGYFSTSLLSLTKIMNQSTEAKALELLLEWNASDAVDEIEQRRNEQVAVYQGNRNPFIDNSNYAEMIWGTGTANPTVQSVSVSPSTLSLDLNGTTTGNLTATVTVINGAAQTVNWTSSNTNVATVSSSGVVTAVARGSCTITATSTVNSNKSASCAVSVADSSGGGGSGESTTITTNIGTYATNHSWSNGTKYTSISLDSIATASVANGSGNTGKYYTSGNEWRFYQSESASIGISVSAGYELDSVTFTYNVTNGGELQDGTGNTVSSGSATSLSGTSTTFTVGNSGSATNGQVKFTAISVTYHSTTSGSTAVLSSISLNTSNVETNFYVGQTFDYSGLVVTAHYEGGTEDIVTPTSVSTPIMSTAGEKTVTVTYKENTVTKTATYTITVSAVSLSSIEVDDQKTNYNVGDTFVEPTVYANYSNNTTVDVTASATFTGYDLSTEGTQTVTVSFGGETTSYDINVITPSEITDSTEYTLVNSVSDLQAGKSYIITNGTTGTVTALGNTENSNNRRGVEAVVSNGRITRGSSVMSLTLGGSTGAWTFLTENYASTDGYLTPGSATGSARLFVNATNDSYGLFSISFSGDAAVITSTGKSTYNIIRYNANNGSPLFACYTSGQGAIYLWKETVPKTLSSISLHTSNVQTTFTVGDTFNYTGLVVTASYSDSTSSTVTPTSVSSPDMSTTGTKTVTVTYEEGGVSKTAEYSITVNSNPSISWTAPTIDVYTGSTLSGTDVNGWAVTYNDGAGHQTVLTYSQLTVKLGGTTISIPHTWVAEDDGKTLTATYSSLTTSKSSAIQITQTINQVYAESSGESGTFSWAQTNTTNPFTAGKTSVTLGGVSWTCSSMTNMSVQGSGTNRHIQFGKSAQPETLVLSTSEIEGTITSISIFCGKGSAGSSTIEVTVGGETFIESQVMTYSQSNYGALISETGSESGDVVITMTGIASAGNAGGQMYLHSIEIEYEGETTYTPIANSTDHIEAQRLAVLFAKTFNDFMAETEYCTTGLSAAWASCSTAYTLFKESAASLGETEEAWCLDLIKYATAQYSDDSGEACIERMMKTYEICVTKHGQTAFMDDIVTLESNSYNPLVLVNSNSANKVVIISVISLISLSIVGGYFFIQRRKEN